MIRLTLPDGTPCAVNPSQVFSISSTEQGTVIWSAYASRVEVTEKFAEVEKRLKAGMGR
jgi:hypothetical protein